MAKEIKVPEDEWREAKDALAKVREMRAEIDFLKGEMQNLRGRWNTIFPASRSELEMGAIAAIQQELGLPRLIEEARSTIQAKVRELSDKFVAEIMMDPRWKEITKNIREDVDMENIEKLLAEVLAEHFKDRINAQEIADKIADAMLENGDVSTEGIEDDVKDRLSEFLEENISVVLEKGGK